MNTFITVSQTIQYTRQKLSFVDKLSVKQEYLFKSTINKNNRLD